MASEKILIVDDEINILNLLKMVLSREGYQVDISTKGEEALRKFKQYRHAVVITDLKMPGMDGIQLLREVKSIAPETEVVVITGYASKDTAVEAMSLGASSYLVKPFDCLDIIPLMLVKTIERQRLLKTNNRMINKLRRYLSEKRQELITFEEFTTKLAGFEDHDELLRTLVSRVATELRTAGTWLWRRRDEQLLLAYQVGLPRRNQRTVSPLDIRTGVIGRVARRGRMMKITDIRKDRRLYCYDELIQCGIRSFYALPLMIAGQVEGVLGVYFSSRRRISDQEIRRMKSFSKQFALALKIIQLYAKLLQSNQQLQKTQELLVQSESLAAMGQLASGIAHELGNPLGIITTTTQYLLENDSPPEEIRECLSVIEEKTKEMNGFILDMLELSRPKDYQFVWTDLMTVIQNTLRFLKQRLRSQNIGLVTQLDRDLPRIFIDPGKIAQALLNILINAIDAMPSSGTLSIWTRLDSKTQEIVIQIEDTGQGIKQEYLPQIFTPFFSRKSGGTGLGLPISRQIINRHHGLLTGENLEMNGARFTIRLPIQRTADSPGLSNPVLL